MISDNCGSAYTPQFQLGIFHPSFFKKQGNSFGHMLNNSLKMGTCELFVATHLDQECGNWALANTCTSTMFDNVDGG